jgi:hypothetical protein
MGAGVARFAYKYLPDEPIYWGTYAMPFSEDEQGREITGQELGALAASI